MKIKVKDNVLVTAGKYRGKSGPVTRVLRKNNKLVIEKINLVKKHIKSRDGVQGGIMSFEKAINASNVKLICPECQKAVRVGYKKEKSHKKQRICKACKANI